MRIHITGARGFLGREVVALLRSSADVTASDVDDLDIVDEAAVRERLAHERPDVLVHLAALKGNQSSRDDPKRFFAVNAIGTLNLLEACRAAGVERFVFMSSLTVHGRSEEEIDEDSPFRPQHPYGATKVAAEALVHAYCDSYGLRAVVLRPNFVSGPIAPPHPYQDNIIYDFILALRHTGVIKLAGDGSFLREWVHVGDVANAVRSAVHFDRPGFFPFILATNRVTMRELAEKVRARVGGGRIVSTGASGFSLISSSARARRDLAWRPEADLDRVVDEIWAENQARERAATG